MRVVQGRRENHNINPDNQAGFIDPNKAEEEHTYTEVQHQPPIIDDKTERDPYEDIPMRVVQGCRENHDVNPNDQAGYIDPNKAEEEHTYIEIQHQPPVINEKTKKNL